jgi:hypothetical protein
MKNVFTSKSLWTKNQQIRIILQEECANFLTVVSYKILTKF